MCPFSQQSAQAAATPSTTTEATSASPPSSPTNAAAAASIPTTSNWDAALSSAVLDSVIDPTMVIGEDGIIVYFNIAACQAFGMTTAQAIGSNVTVLMADEKHAQQHGEYLKNYQQTGQKKMIGRNRVVTCKRFDDTGATWNASLSISEVMLENKRFFVGALRDVTESVEKQQLFSSVIDEAIDAIFTINERGIITLVNRSACQMFGYTENELVQSNVSILMPEPHRSAHDSYIRNHISTGVQKMIGTDRTVTAQRKDGSQFQCRLGLSKLQTNGGKVAFVGLLHDLTHELAARQADARAELADKMRKQKALFLASMSHEIRTPLNGIFGMLELLRSTELDEVQTEWLATCSRSAQSLTTILDDILLFSRADGGGITLERLTFNVRDTIEDAVTVLASQTNDKAVDLVYTVSRSVPDFLIGDPTRLRQVMLIFLSNALKFTQVGHVALEVSLDGVDDDDSSSDDDEEDEEDEDDGKVRPRDDGKIKLKFEVSDTGIGMTKKQLKKLFQPFTQADESTTRQYGGTGLGLSIAKKLVNLMEGDINVESRSNRGSTFAFTALVEQDPDGSTASDLTDKIPEADLELLKGTHILSIDDNAVNTHYLVNLLKLLGCDVTGARSGVDGIELAKLAALREDPYEILLLDFAMPGMSGLEVAEFMANSASIAATHLRVIMLGSIDVHRNIVASTYVHGFTTKPIRRLPLIRMIVEQLKIKRGMLSRPITKGPVALRDESPTPRAPHPVTMAAQEKTMDGAIERKTFNGALGASRPNPINILHVEDNLINQKVIVSILSQWKCNVTTALNGLSGFEERVSNQGGKGFDLVLCDLHMPSCDGFQCVKMIREWEEKNGVKPIDICAVTADASPETRDRCLAPEGGFNEFMAKPLRKNELKEMIVKMCGPGRFEPGTPNNPVRRGSGKGADSSSQSSTTASTATQAGPTHVLVVDDTPTMRLLLRTLLTGMGCRVSEASSGESAVEIVRTSVSDPHERVEMVFCDMRMPPGINGIETARRMKSISGTESLPIIGMTADDVSHVALKEARDVGMVSLISKPLGRTQLSSYLAEHTSTVSLLHERLHTDETSSEESDGDNDNDEGVFDKETALENCGNDSDLLGTLLADMVKDLKTRQDKVAISIQRKDFGRVAEVAHDIKGITAICGFQRLAKAACKLQNRASQGDYIAVRKDGQILQDEISRACRVARETLEA
ncbi:Peroxide stress-activated histidine kinase mak2 [Seminavis robusta]|uniref:Peroxide stress-activated histidine kinase mak2 n=1 Tax=Seminavis robusta TaxID=568900 RepID=A0A9N8HY30_9STRA|nr:Peroxide stress-activated histidine kinase mak2 [Seminavis robusta]|eukprot:Sro2374_g325320.1 Peroxide stress-activated histidine kinase mak2 (1201) ;mRNA; r:6720-10541